MQALRKSVVEQPSQAAPSTDLPEQASRPAGDRRAARMSADEAAALSPALGLREQLTARLEEMRREAGPLDAVVLAEPLAAKLPVPARVAVIAALSLSLWYALYLAVTAIT